MKYRPELDGLRAFAVIPVILFHAKFSLFSGGYIGVDVFFVISGYLITTIIINDISLNRFSLLGFYERRARRILPALFFMIASTLPFAWLLLTKRSLLDYAQNIASVNFFVSNFFFWQRSGYFAWASELKPLLHTWSLAVEEQFYVFFPLLLLVLWRFGTRITIITTLIIAAFSLGLSDWASTRYVDANFFLAPMRAWELLIGVFAAYYLKYRQIETRANNLASALGLTLILVSFFTFDERTPFPSLYALVPTSGAFLVILFANKKTFVGKLLSMRGFVGIGLISYSAYLWHQPILAFSRLYSRNSLTPVQASFLVLVSLVVGWLSWKFIESPFRNKDHFSRAEIFTFSITGGIILIAAGFSVAKLSSAPTFEPVFSKNTPASLQGCDGLIPSKDECIIGAARPPKIAIIGDSHAKALADYMAPSLDRLGISAVQLSLDGCIPIQNLVRVGHNGRCKEFNDNVIDYLTDNPEIGTVILSARWTFYLMKTRFDNTEGGKELGPEVFYAPADIDVKKLSETEIRNLIAKYIQQGIQKLLDNGKRVILVYPVPEVGWDPGRIAQIETRIDRTPFEEIEISTAFQVFQKRNKTAYAALNAIPAQPQLFRILPEKLLCNTVLQNRCVVAYAGKQYYRDDGHLGKDGALLVIDEIVKALENYR